MTLSIVDLSATDDELIDALVPISHRAAAMNSPHWLPTPVRARIEIVRVASGPGVCRVLFEGGEPRGWAGAAPCADTAWELHPLLVDPERHGGGFGRQLVADPERLAAEGKGVLSIRLAKPLQGSGPAVPE